MYRHYLTVAMRNLARYKAFSAINITGLALGMTCCLFIFLWVQDEKRVDNFHTNGETLYNVYQTIYADGQVNADYSTSYRNREGRSRILIDGVRQAVPEIEHMSFYATGYELPWGHAETFQVGDKLYKLEGSRASEDFLTMFSYPVIAGNAKTALKDLSSIAISRKMAEMFFDTPEKAIGQSMRYENRLDLVVTAVFENVPAHSTLKFDFLLNWESHMTRLEWATGSMRTMVQLSKTADIQTVETKMNRFLQAQLDKKEPVKIQLGLQPYRDQYLVSNFVNGKPHGGRIEYVNIFTGVAIFILIIACINFMNLATARSVKRAKEVGVRKVVGSSRSSLIGQFLGEAIVLSFLALIVSLALVHLLLPAFNTFTGKQIVSPITSLSSWIILAALMLFTGFVAGSYPALYLSSLKPARILKGVMKFSNGALWFRKGLAVFQFVISIVLLIVTVVISRQTSYVQHTHLGYNRENLIYIRVEGELSKYDKYLAFKEQASHMPGVALVDRSSEAPHAMGFVVDVNDGQRETIDDSDAIKWEGKERGASMGFKPVSVGFDFLKIMNLQIAEGRDFSRDVSTDSADAFMVNEEAVKQMGMKDPIGKWVSAWNKKGHIIGVLKNYHTHSLHEPIKPLIVDVKEYEYFGVIIARTEPGKTREALASLEQVYKAINPNYPFDYQFLDQEYEKLYRNEAVVARLSNVFAVLAILISCLGLLGLVIFAAEQRTKEIGIRKVLGATVGNIVTLLSKDFVKLVAISFIIAAPVGGFLMQQWLDGFAYKIDLAWWIFVFAGGAALLVALFTVSFQAIAAALTNPVKSLRSE
ncbi:ABC transporter permease [Fulvivirgaceae bacterium PWU4]|uniref:ABC transporter permease n=2 Tax=Chryseosolibacter histidini TaxID=2782349 RepID=A0AAP2GN54_9BACT|nr:ABC transporter permease [Chryseosolibacter histidini]